MDAPEVPFLPFGAPLWYSEAHLANIAATGDTEMSIERREVRVRPKTYQPRKAELEEDMSIRRADGSRPTPAEVARIALSPARIIEDSEA